MTPQSIFNFVSSAMIALLMLRAVIQSKLIQQLNTRLDAVDRQVQGTVRAFTDFLTTEDDDG